MPKRRTSIAMSDEEIDEYLHGRRTMNVASIGPDGRVHLVAMWYGFIEARGEGGPLGARGEGGPLGARGEGGPLGDRALAFWTYGRSQKILNLQRDPRVTCLVESGDEYAQLRGVELVGTATILEDRDDVMAIGRSVFERYNGEWSEGAAAAVARMGAKRVAVRIDVEKVVSWDHTKLGGTY